MQWVSKQTQRVRFFFSFCFIFTKFTSDPYSPPSQLAPSSHSPGPAAALTQLGTPPLLRLCSQGCTLTVSPLDSLSMSFVTPAHDGGLFSGCPLLWGLHSGVEFDLCEEHTQVCLPSFWPQLSAASVQFSRSVMSDSLQPHGLYTPGFPVYHQLPELAQTHVHRVSDAIQPSPPLLSPSPPVFNLSQHQGLFK